MWGEKCAEIKQTIKNIILASRRNSVILPQKNGQTIVFLTPKNKQISVILLQKFEEKWYFAPKNWPKKRDDEEYYIGPGGEKVLFCRRALWHYWSCTEYPTAHNIPPLFLPHNIKIISQGALFGVFLICLSPKMHIGPLARFFNFHFSWWRNQQILWWDEMSSHGLFLKDNPKSYLQIFTQDVFSEHLLKMWGGRTGGKMSKDGQEGITKGLLRTQPFFHQRSQA